MHETYEADWIAGSAAALRHAYDAARAGLAGDIVADCGIEPFEAEGGVSGLLFLPAAPPAAPPTAPPTARAAPEGHAIVYFHGGSWLVGSPETHRVPCSHLAAATGLPVFSVRYGLAPEHPFPRQREDGVCAVAALLGQGVNGRPAPERAVLAGDSAGAAVAFWTEAALPAALRARLAGVAGFYGAYGGIPGPGAWEDEPGGGLSRAELEAAYRRLGPLDRLAAEPGFAIAESAPGDGPPCYLAVGDADPLANDSEALARRLEGLGRPVTLDIAEGLAHSYLHYVGRVEAARASLRRAADWMLRMAEAPPAGA